MGYLLLPRFLILAGLFLMLGSATAIQESAALLARDTSAVCSTYTVAGGDTCAKIAQSHGITVKNIEDYNTHTWAWHGCAQQQQGAFICVSSGEPPMPVALPNAICGPQVPGTVRPKKYSYLTALNPCPASQCVSISLLQFIDIECILILANL
jgi:RES domain-containing protein